MDITGMTFTGGWVMGPYCDPYYSNVSLLLPMDGTNGSTTFVDSGPLSLTPTAIGGAQINTSIVKFGSGSAVFNGSTSYISVPSNVAFALGTGDFTIETWFRANALPSSGGFFPIISNCDTTLNQYFIILLDNLGYINYQIRDTISQFITIGSIPISLNTWTHVAWVRSGNNFYGYVNGVSDQTSTSTKSITQRPILVGGFIYTGFTSYWNGYLDDLRITKGIARYTANFTPPTQAFPTTSC